MEENTLLQPGENGTLEFTAAGVGDARVALFSALVRSCTAERVIDLLESCLVNNDVSALVDVIVLLFQTRHCRGGKGERTLFYTMFWRIAEMLPETCCDLVALVPHYGSYKDLFQLLAHKEQAAAATAVGVVQQHIVMFLAETLLDDFVKLSFDQTEDVTVSVDVPGDDEVAVSVEVNDNDNAEVSVEVSVEADKAKKEKAAQVSLCAKYAPREKGHFAKGPNKWIYTRLTTAMFSENTSQRRAEYRRVVSALRKHLDIVEVKMAANRYGDIDYTKLPSVCTLKHRKAFLNEGRRKSHSEDRVKGRERFLEAIASEQIKGSQVFPHTIVQALRKKIKKMSPEEEALLDVQWRDLRSRVKGLRNMVAMVDVSGSMDGTPMEVAMALGLLTSEVAEGPFRNRVLTFDSNPTWVTFDDAMTIADKVMLLGNAPWGASTNFIKAMRLLLFELIQDKSSSSEKQRTDLLVLSDMQFDAAASDGGVVFKKELSTQPMLDTIATMFEDAGLPVPRIIFWNLRGDTRGFVAQHDSPNVQLLSGFSPALLKLVTDQEGDFDTSKPITPYETFRLAVDDVAYDPVRDVLRASDEGRLALYA